MSMNSEIEKLRKALAEAEAAALEERRRREEEQQRREEVLRQLEAEKDYRNEQEERARKAENAISELSEQLLRSRQPLEPTTLDQYLKYCHIVFRSLEVQLDPTKSSGGRNTDVRGRYYPLFVRPWDDFVQTQRDHFEIIRNVLGDEHLFPAWVGIREIQRHVCGSPVANEEDLKPFEQFAVEAPARIIMNALGARAGVQQALRPFNFSCVSFTNHSYDVSEDHSEAGSNDFGEEDQNQRRRLSPTKRVASEGRRIYPDRRCIRDDLDGVRTIAFVIEYKAAHKVKAEDLRRSLSATSLVTEVIMRSKSSTDTAQSLREKTDQLVAMVLTQTFHYMIELGLEYSYLAAGKSLLFLRIKEDDPRSLYYALVTPDEEACGEDGAVKEFETAVAQLASFCLLAFRSTKRTEAWITTAQNSLCQWPIPYPEMEYKTTDEEEGEEESTQPNQPSDQSFDGSTNSVPSPRLNLRSRSSCKPGVEYHGVRHDSDSDNDHMPQDPSGSVPESSGARSKRKEAPSSSGSRSGSGTYSEKGGQTRQYCTQACLLGLKRGWKLDEACPNVLSHRTTTSDSQHPIQVGELAGLLRKQLARNQDQDCEPLEVYGKHGARGTLFKLTLARYGYTFVGKGTLSENVPYLLHEGKVYKQLERLQGKVVPVFLGNMDMVEPYHMIAMNSYYFTGARIVHMLLMSWVGEEAVKMSVPGLEAEVARLSQAVLGEGVVHGDERQPNILWSEEHRCVMLVDFDRAVLLSPVKHKPARRPSGKKRKRGDDDSGIHRDRYVFLEDKL